MSRVWLHLGFFGGGVLYGFITFCVYGAQCMHHVGVISGVFSFCYVMMGRKGYHIYFITTSQGQSWGQSIRIGFCGTLHDRFSGSEASGSFSFFTSRQANQLGTGSRGTHLTCCTLQNLTCPSPLMHQGLLVQRFPPRWFLYSSLPV